jgi:hypothetical protein
MSVANALMGISCVMPSLVCKTKKPIFYRKVSTTCNKEIVMVGSDEIIVLARHKFDLPSGMTTNGADERFEALLRSFLGRINRIGSSGKSLKRRIHEARLFVALLRGASLLYGRVGSIEGLVRMHSIYLEHCAKLWDLIPDYYSRQVVVARPNEMPLAMRMMRIILSHAV